jgi:hypothetical protein
MPALSPNAPPPWAVRHSGRFPNSRTTSDSIRWKFKPRRGKRKLLGLGSVTFKIEQGTTKTLGLKVPKATRTALKRVKLVLTIRATNRISSSVR